ncbi:XRE family transcriptional regulator [Nonomuraea sp. NN258]|uniref:XRE family transcriptional regulator n=1 Tax=Nonomuraea antri TaxID=2730852 RepID=UPI001568503B|nr:XRE family transcriptional regulator [Nonomuraea antri]NRQ32975.1 XRE family transcriptional regulator [Nonomuraea antri]
MSEPNLLLQQARERLPSPGVPGEHASRQELADLVNAWLYENRNRQGGLTQEYVGKLERGEVRWPNRDYREAFRTILGAERDRDLGFTRSRRATSVVTVADVDRKGFIRTALGAVAAVPLADLALPAQAIAPPAVVHPSDIAELRTIANVFTTWDHTYGGCLVREAVAGQLRFAVGLLKQSRCPAKLHDPLYSAVGWLAHTAAFMAFDAYAHDDARKMFTLALTCAEQANDWHLRAKVLSAMARQAIWCGDPDNGLTLVEFAMVRADRLTPGERAMLRSAQARAFAKLGRVAEAWRAVEDADTEFGRICPGEEKPWMRYYDAAQHSGDTGHALFDLVIDVHGPSVDRRYLDEASTRLAGAVAGHTAAYVRSRAISGIKLASLTMAAGDPEEAASIGGRAVTDAGTVRSRRAQDDMKELARLALPHRSRTPVAVLRHRIREAVQT